MPLHIIVGVLCLAVAGLMVAAHYADPHRDRT